jgi:hypothetical protein
MHTGVHCGVIAGLKPAIHDDARHGEAVFPIVPRFIMDARVEPAHDEL